MSNTRIFLVDGHGLCYRAFYAVKNLSNSKGQPTNAVFGFCNILRKLLNDLKPDHLAVCFDTGKKTHRQTKFADYKVQRPSMPDELISQMDIIRRVVAAYNIPMFEMEGYEADDMMATLAARFSGKGKDVVIVTDDKDMGQLVGDHIKLYSARQQQMISAKDVESKFGVTPDQIVDFIALAGDVSDNIPGVHGIGEVSARKLLSTYGSLKNIYARLDKVTPVKLREKLEAGREHAFLSQELATLHTDLPVDASLEDLKRKEPDSKALFDLYTELEFRKFAKEIFGEGAEDPVAEDLKDYTHGDEGKKDVHIVYDLKALRKSGRLTDEAFKGDVFDVHLADYLLSGGQGKYNMPSLRSSEEGLRELYTLQKAMLKEQGIEVLFYDIEMPLADVLARMEKNGVRLDKAVLEELSKECAVKIKEAEDSLFEIAGTTFNLNSPKQLSEVLFERLKLPVIKKTKTGFSTDEEVLTRLAAKHPLPALILEYRQVAKLKSTYIDALPQLVDPADGRLHASFNQTGAETGRLSSNNPNLQNIPIRTDLGRRIRKAFVPYAKGHVLLSADYSQIELRVLAHLCGDANLKKAFAEGADIHRYTASLIFDTPESKVDDNMRTTAKRINFGIIYGMSSFGLAKDLGVPIKEAQDFIDRYFLRYPKVRTFMDDEIVKAREQGYVTTLLCRRRYLPEIHNANMGLRQFAERQAINTPVQGTAADLIKLAMVNIDRLMTQKKMSSTMILTVHDELVFDVPQKEIGPMASLVRTEMEGVIKLSVPVKATVKTGPNWLEMSPLQQGH